MKISRDKINHISSLIIKDFAKRDELDYKVDLNELRLDITRIMTEILQLDDKADTESRTIPKRIIIKHGAVSYETCLAMVKNLSKISKTHVSVSITGIAGPRGGTKEKPVGLVYIGLKKGNKIVVKKYLFKNKNRNSIQKATVIKALNLILSIFK